MRIKSLKLSNFRCFQDSFIDLDADVVAIYGRNGVGKTALYDAIEFALFGHVHRLSRFDSTPAPLRHVYANDDDETVVKLSTNDSAWVETSVSSNLATSVKSSGGWSTHLDTLYGYLIDPDFFPPRRKFESVEEMFRATLFLSQDSIRRFVEGDPSDRASVLATLAGSAHLLRFSEKAAAVVEEADRRARRASKRIADLTEQIAETEKALADRTARIGEVSYGLAQAKEPSFGKLHQTLSLAGLPVTDVPEDPAALGLFVEGVQATIEERRSALRSRADIATSLAVGWESHLSRIDRLASLGERLSELFGELDSAMSAQSQAEGLDVELRKKLESTRASVESISRFASSVVREGALAEKLLEQFQEIEELEPQIREDEVNVDAVRLSLGKLSTKLSTSENEYKMLNGRIAQLRQRTTELLALSKSVEKRKDLQERLAQLEREIEQNRVSENEIEGRFRVTQVELSRAQDRINQLKNAMGDLTSVTAEKNELIARLASHVTDETCPLCGVKHESHDALLDAIKRSLESVSPALAALTEELSVYRNSLESIKEQEVGLVGKRGEIRSLIDTGLDDRDQITNTLNEQDELALQLNTIASRASVDENLADAHESLANMISQFEGVERKRKADLEAQASDRNLANQIRNKLDAKKEQIQRLRASHGVTEREHGLVRERNESDRANLSLGTDADLSNQWATLRNEIGVLTADLQNNKTKLNVTAEDVEGLQKRISANEDEKGGLTNAEVEFQRMCADLQLDHLGDAEEIKSIQNSFSLQLNALRDAESALVLHELELRRRALQEDIGEITEKRDGLQREQLAIDSDNEKLANAKQQANKWSESLRDQVNDAIVTTAGNHQLRIERHFKSLIPSPHQFDHVALTVADQELNLGLRFRGLSEGAGEPRLFLSNAQANVLALAIFLSFGSTTDWTRLETLLLDDPVQHLDDLDAVAFLDTLRATSLGRFGRRKQIIVSTCDRNLYLMILKKFRSLEKENLEFRGISLVGHGTAGPEVIYDYGEPAATLSTG